MTTFCDEIRISVKGDAIINQPIVSDERLADIRSVLVEASQLTSPTGDVGQEISDLKKLMERTKRCLKTVERQQLMTEATQNIQKVTAVIKDNYGKDANRVMSARLAFEHSKQLPTTDLSSLDQDPPGDE